MERDEIRQKFEAAIDEAVSGAGAKLERGTKDELSQMAGAAAFHNATRIDEEEEQEGAVNAGIAAYQKLVGRMVTVSKTVRSFPELGRIELSRALQELGPEPPFYMA